MPLFFGRKDKDTITARLYIDHIETTARITNWDDAWKLSEIYLVLHDRDIIWCNLLEDAGIDRAIKNEFLSFDKPRYTAMITCANITELTQCQGEGLHNYYLLVHDAFLKYLKPSQPTLPLSGSFLPTLLLWSLLWPLTISLLAKRRSLWCWSILKHQLFLAGLNKPIHGKVMEANKDTLHNAMCLAVELKTIHKDPKWGQVATICEEDKFAAAIDYKAETILAMTKLQQLMQSVNTRASHCSIKISAIQSGSQILTANQTSPARRRGTCSESTKNAFPKRCNAQCQRETICQEGQCCCHHQWQLQVIQQPVQKKHRGLHCLGCPECFKLVNSLNDASDSDCLL